MYNSTLFLYTVHMAFNQKEYDKKRYARDRDKILANRKKYYIENIEVERARARERHYKNRDRNKIKMKEYWYRLRMQTFEAYGGQVCACCGEEGYNFLTIDHINGDGAQHRRDMGTPRVSGASLYRWLRDNNYPGGFQVLCWNCNCGKARNNNVCPHKG